MGQTQAPDADLEQALAGYCLEIKRTGRWEERYWQQAVEQAEARCEAPALAHKQDRNRWLVMVRAADVGLETESGRVSLEADDWLARVKEKLVAAIL